MRAEPTSPSKATIDRINQVRGDKKFTAESTVVAFGDKAGLSADRVSQLNDFRLKSVEYLNNQHKGRWFTKYSPAEVDELAAHMANFALTAFPEVKMPVIASPTESERNTTLKNQLEEKKTELEKAKSDKTATTEGNIRMWHLLTAAAGTSVLTGLAIFLMMEHSKKKTLKVVAQLKKQNVQYRQALQQANADAASGSGDDSGGYS